ncbi:hypothetical protein FRB99_000344 [Tulasnella sp. 403]|nr:hypothetical protein FRB99_000344 [Tulasnella sp. 403]
MFNPSENVTANVYRTLPSRPVPHPAQQQISQNNIQHIQQLQQQPQQQQHDPLNSQHHHQQLPQSYQAPAQAHPQQQLQMRQQQQQQQLFQQHPQSHPSQPMAAEQRIGPGPASANNSFLHAPPQQQPTAQRVQSAAAQQQTQINALSMIPGFNPNASSMVSTPGVGPAMGLGPRPGAAGPAGMNGMPMGNGPAGVPGGVAGLNVGGVGMSAAAMMSMQQRRQGNLPIGVGGMGAMAGQQPNSVGGLQRSNPNMFNQIGAGFNPSMALGAAAAGMMNGQNATNAAPGGQPPGLNPSNLGGVHPTQSHQLTQSQLSQQMAQHQQHPLQQQGPVGQLSGQVRPPSTAGAATFQPPNNASPGRPPSTVQQHPMLQQNPINQMSRAAGMGGPMGPMGGVTHLGGAAGSPARHSPLSAAGTPVATHTTGGAAHQHHMNGMNMGQQGHPSGVMQPGQMPTPMMPHGRPPSRPNQHTSQPGQSQQQHGGLQQQMGAPATGRVPTPQSNQSGLNGMAGMPQRNVGMPGMSLDQQSQQQHFGANSQDIMHIGPGAPQSGPSMNPSQSQLPMGSTVPGNFIATPSQQAQTVKAYAGAGASNSGPQPSSSGPGHLNPGALVNQPKAGSAGGFVPMTAFGATPSLQALNHASPSGALSTTNSTASTTSPTNQQNQQNQQIGRQGPQGMRQPTPMSGVNQSPMAMNIMGRPMGGAGMQQHPQQQIHGMPPPQQQGQQQPGMPSTPGPSHPHQQHPPPNPTHLPQQLQQQQTGGQQGVPGHPGGPSHLPPQHPQQLAQHGHAPPQPHNPHGAPPPTPLSQRGSLPPSVRIPQRTPSGNAPMTRTTSTTETVQSVGGINQPGAVGGLMSGPVSGPGQATVTHEQFKYTALAHLGSGQGVIRMLEFSHAMAAGKDQSLQYWEGVTSDFFDSPKGLMRMTLWKDNEARPFEVSSPTLPRFFFSSFCSGVVSIHLTLNNVRESSPAAGEGVVDCPNASFTYTFDSGYIVVLRGPLRAHIILVPSPPEPTTPSTSPHQPPQSLRHTLKFSYFEFSSKQVSKSLDLGAIKGIRVPLPPMGDEGSPMSVGQHGTPSGNVHNGVLGMSRTDTPMNGIPAGPGAHDGSGSGMGGSPTMATSASQAGTVGSVTGGPIVIERAYLPPDPVNGFGITESTMRVLELAESVTQMGDLIQMSFDHHLGPIESLHQFANKVREQNPEEYLAREEVIAQATMQAAVSDPMDFFQPQFRIPTPSQSQGTMMQNGMLSGQITASPAMLHLNGPQQQQPQHPPLGGHNMMGMPHNGMPPGHGMTNQPPTSLDMAMNPNAGGPSPHLANGNRTPQIVHQANPMQSPRVRPASSGGPPGSQAMPPPGPLGPGNSFQTASNIGPNAKRKATLDGGPPDGGGGGGPDSQGPPARRQRTSGLPNGGAGNFSEGSGVGTAASPPEPGMNTRNKGRKSPVTGKVPQPARPKRRGTNA